MGQKWVVKSFRIQISEKFKGWQTLHRRVNIRQLNGEKCFQASARCWGRRPRRSQAGKQISIRQSGRRLLIIRGCFWLLLWPGVFYDTSSETKANGGRVHAAWNLTALSLTESDYEAKSLADATPVFPALSPQILRQQGLEQVVWGPFQLQNCHNQIPGMALWLLF